LSIFLANVIGERAASGIIHSLIYSHG
jgi:hypothetical protein